MFKNILIVYGLLCIGSLCLTRSEELAEDAASEEPLTFSKEFRRLRKDIKDLRKEFNEKLANVTEILQRREEEIATLQSSVTELLQHVNSTVDGAVVRGPQSPITGISVAQQRCRSYTQQAEGLNCSKNTFMALLGFRNDPIMWNGYSGVVISDRYILTSGYATRFVDGSPVTHVALGVKEGQSFDKDYRRHEITDITAHPKYEYGYMQASYNLALLRTDAPIQFNDRVQPACLPSLGAFEVQQHALLTTYKQGPEKLGHVHTVPMQQYSDKKCVESDSRYNSTIHMCFGHRPALGESTQVNIGDPAVVRNNGSACVSTVVGVTSYGSGAQKPLGYTRVSYFVNWIERVVWPGETQGH